MAGASLKLFQSRLKKIWPESMLMMGNEGLCGAKA